MLPDFVLFKTFLYVLSYSFKSTWEREDMTLEDVGVGMQYIAKLTRFHCPIDGRISINSGLPFSGYTLPEIKFCCF